MPSDVLPAGRLRRALTEPLLPFAVLACPGRRGVGARTRPCCAGPRSARWRATPCPARFERVTAISCCSRQVGGLRYGRARSSPSSPSGSCSEARSARPCSGCCPGLAAPLPGAVRTQRACSPSRPSASHARPGWVRIPLPQNARQIPPGRAQRRITARARCSSASSSAPACGRSSRRAPRTSSALGLVLAHQGAAMTILAGTGFAAGRAATAARALRQPHETGTTSASPACRS